MSASWGGGGRGHQPSGKKNRGIAGGTQYAKKNLGETNLWRVLLVKHKTIQFTPKTKELEKKEKFFDLKIN